MLSIQFAAKVVAVPGVLSSPWRGGVYAARNGSLEQEEKMLPSCTIFGGKRVGGGDKIRAFHSHAARQRLIYCIEEVITNQAHYLRREGLFLRRRLCREEGRGGLYCVFPAEFKICYLQRKDRGRCGSWWYVNMELCVFSQGVTNTGVILEETPVPEGTTGRCATVHMHQQQIVLSELKYISVRAIPDPHGM